MEKVRSETTGSRGLVVLLVLALLAGLPLAVWLDMRNLTEANLLRQARDLNSVVSSVRAYYASNVVGRVLASPGSTQVVHNYETIPGAIPIPATLSLELGRVISEQQQNISYRFVSDFPFKNRTPHPLDVFETGALYDLRENSNQHSDRRVGVGLHRTRPPGCPGDHGAGLRELPQLASRKPEEGLEGRRCPRHSGDHHQPGDRDQHILVQISAGLFRVHGRVRRHLHRRAAAPGRDHPGHESASSRPPTNSSPLCR